MSTNNHRYRNFGDSLLKLDCEDGVRTTMWDSSSEEDFETSPLVGSDSPTIESGSEDDKVTLKNDTGGDYIREEDDTPSNVKNGDNVIHSRTSACLVTSAGGTRTLESNSEDTGSSSLGKFSTGDVDGGNRDGSQGSDFECEAEVPETFFDVIPAHLRSWIFGRTVTVRQRQFKDEADESKGAEYGDEQHYKLCDENSEGGLVQDLPRDSNGGTALKTSQVSDDNEEPFKQGRNRYGHRRLSLTQDIEDICVARCVSYALGSMKDALALRVVHTSILGMICPLERSSDYDSIANKVRPW